MLTALRRRLTLLMTALTSLVLAGALVVTWNYAAAQYRTAAETLLTQNFSAIVDRLDSADSVSDAWLADQEHNSGCLLFLWDNGAALHFAGTTGSADARNAVEPLLEEGLSPLLDTSLHDSSGAVQRQSAVFTLNEYRCHAALLPRGTAGSYLLVAALQDMGFVHRHAVQTVVQYGAIWFTGTLLLAIISWRLTGKALAPTALAMRRQKEFIAAAGHELRSPLAVVKASLDAACRTPVTERATLLRNAEQETDRMARLVEDLLVLANGLAEAGVKNIAVYDVSSTHVSTLISEVFRCSHIVLACPTYNNSIYPAMYNFIHDMEALLVQNRTVGIIQNGTWNPASGKLIQAELESMKNITLLEPVVTVKSSLKEDSKAQLDALKDAIVESLKG